MVEMFYTTLDSNNEVGFRWKPIEDANLYRIIVRSSSGIALDLIRNKSDLEMDGNLQFQFKYCVHYPEKPAFIPRFVSIGTRNELGTYSAHTTFTLLGEHRSDNIEILGADVEDLFRKDFEDKLNEFLSSSSDSSKLVDISNSDRFAFSRGLLSLELNLETDLQSSEKVPNFSNFVNLSLSVLSGSGQGGWPPPPFFPR